MRNTKTILGCLLCLAVLIGGCGHSQEYVGASIDAGVIVADVAKQSEQYLSQEKDKYASYYTKAEYDKIMTNIRGVYGGIGVYFATMQDSGAHTIVGVMKNTPAAQVGLKAGDIVIAVNGENIEKADIDYIAALIKGEEGKQLVLTIKRENEELKDYALTREIIMTPTMEGKMIPNTSFAYFVITSFTENSAYEFAQMYNDLAKEQLITGLIFDLRGNPGGSLNGAVGLASFFVSKDEPIVWIQDKSSLVAEKSVGYGLNLPLVVLVNENSASASELFSGAMQDYKRAVVVGTTTFGKGIAQIVTELPSGAGLKFTNSKYLTPLMRSVHEVGVKPDIPVQSKKDDNIYSVDPTKDFQLKIAIDTMTSLIK